MDAALQRALSSLNAVLDSRGIRQGREALLETQCLPLARALAERVAGTQGCQLIGFAGAQGTGKSTLAALVQVLLNDGFGLRCLVISLDDFYLTRAARRALAARVHPLLATRGVPGTHEVELLRDSLQRARVVRTGESLTLPRFSKADDDRSSETRSCEGPFELVLFEGWCVGARPQTPAELSTPINALERDEDPAGVFRGFVNAQLAQPYAALWAELDALAYLAAPDFATVLAFRAQQEQALHATARPDDPGLMSDAQLARFMQYFERVTRHMLATTPSYADIVLRLDADRHVLALETVQR
jgi:D-glycerate 3-kinase